MNRRNKRACRKIDVRGRAGVLAAVLCIFFGGTAAAQDSGLGTGLVAGEPWGLNAKLWVSELSAIDFTAAWSFYRRTDAGMQKRGARYVHIEYLRHFYNIVPAKSGRYVYFVGIGAKFAVNDENYFGIRLPIGMSYMLEDQPVDIFLEIAPSIVLFRGPTSDTGAYIGIRYWFK